MKKAIVVTSINAPNPAMRALADGARQYGFDFIVVGDATSPRKFVLDGCQFLSIDDQLTLGLRFAAACPVHHYGRKNVGYLFAMSAGADIIVETDDDNLPRADFFDERHRQLTVHSASGTGWLNVFRYFTSANIWPRGLPLGAINLDLPPFEDFSVRQVDCPIQQGLADEDPDVDAIYRLILPLPQRFRTDRRIALGRGAWCPFNSQNTTWWSDAFPLLYLPAFCSFRMSDIWRSFVAQRIAWENGWQILIHEPTVWQERNDHNLMRDFADEVPGYLNNDRIRQKLEDTSLNGGIENLSRDLRRCYQALSEIEIVNPNELRLLDTWIADFEDIMETRNAA